MGESEGGRVRERLLEEEDKEELRVGVLGSGESGAKGV